MQRATARQAEVADVISDHPIALQLRNLQILTEIATEKNSAIVFPAQSLESVRGLTRFVGGEAGRGAAYAPELRTRREPVGSGSPVPV